MQISKTAKMGISRSVGSQGQFICEVVDFDDGTTMEIKFTLEDFAKSITGYMAPCVINLIEAN